MPPTSSARGSASPLRSTWRVFHSSSKFSVKAAATAWDSTVAITFSCSDHASLVQLVDPVHTERPSRTTYLWCIRSGIPGMPSVGSSSDSIRSGSVSGGGGTGTARSCSCSRL